MATTKRPATKSKTKPSNRGAYTAPILVGLTPGQNKTVKQAAKASHVGVGVWARVVLLGKADEILEPSAPAPTVVAPDTTGGIDDEQKKRIDQLARLVELGHGYRMLDEHARQLAHEMQVPRASLAEAIEVLTYQFDNGIPAGTGKIKGLAVLRGLNVRDRQNMAQQLGHDAATAT